MNKFQDYRRLHIDVASPATKLWAKSLLVGTQTQNQNQLRKWLQKRVGEVDWLGDESNYLKRRFRGAKMGNNEKVLTIERLQPNSSKILTHSFWQLLNTKSLNEVCEISYTVISNQKRRKLLNSALDLSSTKESSNIYMIIHDYLDLLTNDLISLLLSHWKPEGYSYTIIEKCVLSHILSTALWEQRSVFMYFELYSEVHALLSKLEPISLET